MSHAVGTVILAGVAHLPKHDPGWAPGFLALLGIFGCVLVCAGVALTRSLLRVKDGKNWFNFVFGPVVLVIGLAMAVVGFGFAFRLL
ncbi:hypothetical protein ACWIG5_07070 [Streptomyces lydicus]